MEVIAIWAIIRGALVATGGWLGWFLGGVDALLYALIAFVFIDYFIAICRAVMEKQLCSEIGIRGIVKKLLIFAMVGVAHITDTYLIGGSGMVSVAAKMFFIANEGLSILENASRAGLPIPPKLQEVLLQLNKSTDTNKQKEEAPSRD